MKYIQLMLILLFGIIIWHLPHPEQVTDQAWHLFACFVATIIGIIIHPLPMGCMAFLGLGAIAVTGVLPFNAAFSGFSKEVVWLIVFAFFIARGFIKTGLGARIAYIFLEFFGRKTLGLGYGIVATELVLAPAIPSSTARSGGMILPILESLANTFDSKPHTASAKKMGAFLTQVAFQANVITSAMFLTSMAANPLIADLAAESGIRLTWGMWFLAASVPGLVSLMVIPLIVYWIYPPEIKETPHATEFARSKLNEMGRIKKNEWIMLATFILLIVFWIFGSQIGMRPAVTALLGLIILLVTDVLTWKDIRKEEGAWETLIWFSVLLMMTAQLTELGFMEWFNNWIANWFYGLQWQWAFMGLSLAYFYTHYFFTSNIAHAGAMFPTFLTVSIALGTPPYLAAFVLAFCTSLFACLTHYGCGPAAVLFGVGYVPVGAWMRNGFVISLAHILIWSVIGGFWWKLIGIW